MKNARGASPPRYRLTAAQRRRVRRYLPVVERLARRHSCSSPLPMADLIQEGALGLIRAVKRSGAKPQRPSALAYQGARRRILGAIDQGDHVLGLPTMCQQALRAIRDLEERMREAGQRPTVDDVCRHVGVSQQRARRLLGVRGQRVRLRESQAAVHSDAEPPRVAEKHELSEHVREALERLRPRDRRILEEHHGLGGKPFKSLQQLAEGLRISRERVRQIERRAIERLRVRLGSRYAEFFDEV